MLNEIGKNQVNFTDGVKTETSRKNNIQRRPTSGVPRGFVIANEDDDDDYYDDLAAEGEEYNEYEGEGSVDNELAQGPIAITETILKQIQQELCLIKLSWPEITYDSLTTEGNYLPSSYTSNNNKEKLLLWYAENFRKQYHAIYTERKPLILARDNEYGIQKFVSTTIKRSSLPYPEFYTWQGCAKFVSDHLTYEPLINPILMPERICSPTRVLGIQGGNCFEFSTLLTSLLLGQGYNAYVVSGYASREQVRCDLTRKVCPYLPKQESPQKTAPPPISSRYRMKPPPDMRSKFLLEMEARELKKLEDDLRCQEEERMKMIEELERPPPDKYWGYRIHAWVVIVPDNDGARKGEVTEPIFIEPTSAEHYYPRDNATNNLYLGVESMWNDQNYWVNMQVCADGCASIDWDFTKPELWEHLLPGEPWSARGVEEDALDEELNVQADKHLDLPASWVEKIQISSVAYERRYPGASKTVLYKKTKLELFAPYAQRDGLIQKITLFEDYEYTSPTSIYETYANRADRLVKIFKDSDTESVVDYYERGRPDACKEHRYFTSDTAANSETSLDFYDVVRLDGLTRIEMHPSYLVQHFVNRQDRLYYRYVQYVTEKTTSVIEEYVRVLWKITEKYHRNESIPASKDIAIREFAVGENEIRLKYHYERGKGTRATRTFVKPLPSDRGERLVFNPEMTTGYNPDPMAPPEKSLVLYYELDKQLKEEELCRTLIASAEDEVKAFLKGRTFEYSLPTLVVSLFDRNRNEEAKAGMFAREEILRAQSKREVVKEVDYLGPYLARLGNPTYLDRSEALQVQHDCLTDFKQKLVDRANCILETFEKTSEELKRTHARHSQVQEFSQEDEETFQREMNDAIFNLNTLEMQLNRCRELATDRYRMLLENLRADPRLSIIYQPG